MTMKKKYFKPVVVLGIVECEEGIAAYSANVTFGGADNSISPEVENWENEDKGFVVEL